MQKVEYTESTVYGSLNHEEDEWLGTEMNLKK